MRNAFISEILKIAAVDAGIWLITGDLGYGVLEPFAKQFPERFLNAGVAEQNMTGIAAGLALDGRTVLTYSIANFPTFRCLEQIRNDICYHNGNVKIISVGAGVAYGLHGYTHFGIEDLAVMRCLPNMKILSPADPAEARRAAHLATSEKGPVYVRIGKNGEPALHKSDTDFGFGSSLELHPFTFGGVAILATGSIAFHASKATEILKTAGVDAACFSLPSLLPFDESLLRRLADEARLIVTVEEHGAIGGLGSMVAERLCRHRSRCPLLPLALPSSIALVGNQEFLLSQFGLDCDGIAKRVIEELHSL